MVGKKTHTLIVIVVSKGVPKMVINKMLQKQHDWLILLIHYKRVETQMLTPFSTFRKINQITGFFYGRHLVLIVLSSDISTLKTKIDRSKYKFQCLLIPQARKRTAYLLSKSFLNSNRFSVTVQCTLLLVASKSSIKYNIGIDSAMACV